MYRNEYISIIRYHTPGKYLAGVLLFVITSSTFLSGQVNIIIPFEFGNPNPTDLTFFNNRYNIPVIYTDSLHEQTIVVTDGEIIEYVHHDSFVYSNNAITCLHNYMFIYGKDRTQSKGLKIARLDNNLSIDFQKNIQTSGEYNFPGNSYNINDHNYLTYFVDRDNDNQRIIGLTKHDDLGQIVWNESFNTGYRYSYPWSVTSTKEDYILLANTYNISAQSPRKSQLMIINPDSAAMVKTILGYEEIHSTSRTNAICLNNSNIVEAYEVDRLFDPEFNLNGWYPFPTRLNWYNSDGILVQSRLMIVDFDHQPSVVEMLRGKGDYFFIFGTYIHHDTDDNYAWILKLSNEGDTIWTHRYRHSGYAFEDIGHRIEGLVEHEDKSLAILCVISEPASEQKMWLFTVDSNGCHPGADCDDIIEFSASENLESKAGLNIYPNPAHAFILVPDDWLESEIKIYSQLGKLVFSSDYLSSSKIDIRHIKDGIYYISSKEDPNRASSGSFVKISN